MPNILLIGDSHAAHFFGALNDLLPEVLFSQVTASGCRPTIEYGGSPRCTELMQYAIEDLLPSGDFQGVIISGRWRSEDIAALVRTVEQLSKLNIVVIVLGPIISYDQALPRLLSRFDRISGYDSKIRSAQNYSDARQLDVTIRSALAETKGVYISILDAICPHGRCDVYAKSGVPMQWDTAHLTHEGAIKLVEGIRGDIKVSIEKREASADVARP